MIKLTGLRHDLTEEALMRYHEAEEDMAADIFERNTQQESCSNYISRPYAPIFKFEDDDYNVTEYPLRIDPNFILDYKVNVDGDTEILMSYDKSYVIKEDINFLDEILIK